MHVCSLLASSLAGAASVVAQVPYRIQVIEPTGSTSLTETGVSDVSNGGRVVGSTHGGEQYRWFEWTETGGFSGLPLMFQSSTNPNPNVGLHPRPRNRIAIPRDIETRCERRASAPRPRRSSDRLARSHRTRSPSIILQFAVADPTASAGVVS